MHTHGDAVVAMEGEAAVAKEREAALGNWARYAGGSAPGGAMGEQSADELVLAAAQAHRSEKRGRIMED